MRSIFQVSIARPGKHLLTFEAKNIRLPAHNGFVGFMANRQPLLTTLDAGIITILDITDHNIWFGTTGGFCEMLENKATLLCDSLFAPEEIDFSKIVIPGPVYRKNSQNMSEKEKATYVTMLMKEFYVKLKQESA
ncbi:MAG: F0F1 ATP synthase subunit epsilon [Erysipelotrichia bacterium]|nr:F0F1 ATP synthase subunit epsilon [Erysipelotrichia bacterium]